MPPVGAQTQGTLPYGGAAAPGAGALGGGALGGGALGGGTEARLDRLERMLNEQALSDLVLQLQRLQQEVQELRGQVEVQQYRMQQMDRGGFAGFGAGPVRPPLPGGDAGAPTGSLIPAPFPAQGVARSLLPEMRAPVSPRRVRSLTLPAMAASTPRPPSLPHRRSRGLAP